MSSTTNHRASQAKRTKQGYEVFFVCYINFLKDQERLHAHCWKRLHSPRPELLEFSETISQQMGSQNFVPLTNLGGLHRVGFETFYSFVEKTTCLCSPFDCGLRTTAASGAQTASHRHAVGTHRINLNQPSARQQGFINDTGVNTTDYVR